MEFIYPIKKIVEFKFNNLETLLTVLKGNQLTFELTKGYHLRNNDCRYLDTDFYQLAIQVTPSGTLKVFHLENPECCKNTDELFSCLMGEQFLKTLLNSSEQFTVEQ